MIAPKETERIDHIHTKMTNLGVSMYVRTMDSKEQFLWRSIP
jgi:hypothetical protein